MLKCPYCKLNKKMLYPLLGSAHACKECQTAINGGHTPKPALRVQIFEDGGKLPVQGHPGDAGIDLFVSEDCIIPPHSFIDVPTGIKVAFPEGLWGRIAGRSSTFRKRNLLVLDGTIDNGYRGPLFAGVYNITGAPITVKKGERLAQLIMAEVVAVQSIQVDTFDDDTQRGEGGFGSTGGFHEGE